MSNFDTVVELTPSAFSLVTSRINRALTPHSIASALIDEATTSLVPFDRCCLILPSNTTDQTRDYTRRALCIEPGVAGVINKTFDATDSPFFPALSDGKRLLLHADDLASASDIVGSDAQSALVLPLSTDGRSFGALCLVSITPDAYTKDAAQDLQWLVDMVAAATQAALIREQLEATTEARRELERLKSGFVSTLVRDIRLPLTSVLGLLELIESKLQARESFDLEDWQLLTGAIEQGARIRHLMDDLLEITRHQEKPLSLRTEDAEAGQLIEEVIEPLRGEAALSGIELNIRVAPSTPELHVDMRQARRALCYLFQVALAATPAGGRISIGAQSITGTRVGDAGRRFVVINVADSSPGIPAEELPYVFDAFGHSSNPQRGASPGIGLAIAKRIAAAHGGNVAVRSQVGVGTVYSIILPAKELSRATAQTRRILIVDDAPEILLLLGKLITRMGYQVTTAASVARALEFLNQHDFDLVITDWAMPEANGGDLITTLKSVERWRNLPTVVLTGHDTESERRDARAAGCDRFLVKPVLRDELQRVITELVSAESVN